MSISSVHDPNVAINMKGRFALYIEGQQCAFSQCQVMIEDGLIPRVAINVPATPMMRDLSRRVRVHLLVKEYQGDWVVFFEGEILTRGFQKTPQSRDLTFMAYHVAGLFDQYAVTALDPVSAVTAAMQGQDIANPSIGSVNGNIINLFTPEAVASELKALGFKVKPNAITFSHFVTAAFHRYKKLIGGSRVRGSYPHVAVDLHRLIERVRTPDPQLIDWDQFYTQLIGETLTGTAQAIGGRVTFFELMRTMAQYFLHQVTINPHAESVYNQIQVKPQTFFNAIPRCNVVYSSMTDAYEFSENYAEKPTRLQGQFYPPGAPASDKSAALSRYFTVYGPTELQWRWMQICDELEKTSKGGQQAGLVQFDPKTGELAVNAPKDGIPFITREETSRGIISGYYDVPRTLNAAVMALITKGTGDATTTSVAEVADDQIPAKAYEAIQSDDEEDRVAKYWAFLCMALGDGNGIDPRRFKTGFEGDYHKKGDKLILMPLSGPSGEAFSKRQAAVPTKVTYLGLKMSAGFSGEGEKRSRVVVNHRQIRGTGVNYFVAADGTIIQVMPRDRQMFAEAMALPYGIQVQGVTAAEAMDLNARVPLFGISQDDTAKNPMKWNSSINSDVWTGAWPFADKPEPRPDANGMVDAIAIKQSLASHPLTIEQFGFLAPREDDVTVRNVFTNGKGETEVVKLIDKDFRTVDGNQYVYLRFSKPVVRKSDVSFYVIRILSKQDISADAHPYRPWVIIPEGAGGPQPITKQNLENLVKQNQAITNKAQLAGGNHQNVVIGFDSNDGKGPTSAQVESIGFLTAAIKELTSQAIGTSKAPKRTPGEREQFIKDDAVKQASDLYPGAGNGFTRLDAWMGSLKGATSKWQSKLFADFSTWDAKLREGKVEPLAAVLSNPNPVDDVNPVVDMSTTPSAKAEAGVANLVDDLEGAKVEISDKSMGKFIDYYASAIVNFQFHNQRYAPQSFSAPMVFNPYMMVGYPALLLDDSEAKYHLVAYVHALNHIITPNAAQTQVTYTHVRNARYERAIPYKSARTQLFRVQLANMKDFDLNTEKGRKAYDERLKAMGLTVNTFLPIEMMSINRQGKPNEVPFVFHGGFGLGKGRKQDYSYYAKYVGYVDENGKPLSNSEAVEKFIFADDPMINFNPEDSEEVAEREDIDTVKALNRIYRPIQKVGQNDPKKRQASFVAFDGEAVESSFLKTIGADQDEGMASDRIRVLKDGKGGVFKFDVGIQEKVREHTALVMDRAAMLG